MILQGWVPYELPMVEGRCAPITFVDSKGQIWSRYPDPDPDYVDPEIKETDRYSVCGEEEFYDYVVVCKLCGTEFIAYNDNKPMRRYCPGCGERLEVEE